MMNTKGPRSRKGFTLIELMITTVIMLIVGLAIGVVIVDGQTGYSKMYDRMNSNVVADGYVARKKFDSVMRSASREQSLLAADGSWVEVYSYARFVSPVVDRYYRFYVSDGDLNLEYGQLDPRATINVETVCQNVSSCTFKQVGTSLQMTLKLDDGTQTNTVISSAITHNQ
jgi:prepilin-type N-terminal cleavage/methylation domain-containing protein